MTAAACGSRGSWVIVIFYAVSVCRNRDGAAREAEAEAEAGVRSSRDVRNLLAKRMVDAVRSPLPPPLPAWSAAFVPPTL